MIDERSHVTVGAKVVQVKRDMRARDVELSFVVLDHLDFVDASDRYRGLCTLKTGEIILGVKEIVRSQGVCVLLRSQRSREVEKRSAKQRRPTLADLRKSGNLEQVIAPDGRQLWQRAAPRRFIGPLTAFFDGL